MSKKKSKKALIKELEELTGIKNVAWNDMKVKDIQALIDKFKKPGGLVMELGIRKAESYIEKKTEQAAETAEKIRKRVRDKHPILSGVIDFLSERKEEKKKKEEKKD